MPLYETSFEKIENHFGSGYQVVNRFDYSIEHTYIEKGISFSYKRTDSINKMIYWINLKTKGNSINIEDKLKINEKTIVSDIIEIFGSGQWDYDSTYNGLIIEYDYFDFVVKLTDETFKCWKIILMMKIGVSTTIFLKIILSRKLKYIK
ncbi:hypothetical protein JCM19296_3719 [Nonlabens ulvanivorans]|uniref:Uncharacterized protein n=1 Tax=Nonlabens ulvanivorans TaxID=906888 RepID=A0A081DGQ9_NONUL|nr:hypothetical protein [Nonlabens ulvanivorans]GAK78105.1 hypothetical protein JCM19296_3719 [Nonlabens ulvanivorans]